MKKMNAALRPRVSVIITTSGDPKLLQHALESIVAQTFVYFEAWVIGDHCSDESEDIVQAFCDPRLMWFNTPSETNDEYRLILEGLKRCRGSYIAYLRGDDIWLPNHLEILVDAIESRNADVAFSITQYVHSRAYSTLNMPLLPDLHVLPHISSLVHRRDCLYFSLPDKDNENYVFDFFQRARLEKLVLEGVPAVTGLRFLVQVPTQGELLQAFYMQRLRTDPDFVNRELSAILLRTGTERFHSDFDGKIGWASWLAKPLQRVLKAMIGSKTEMRAAPTSATRNRHVNTVTNDANAA